MTKTEQAIWTYIVNHIDTAHSYATLARAVGTTEQHSGQCVRRLVKGRHLEVVQQLRTGTTYRANAPERADFLARAAIGEVSPFEAEGWALAGELDKVR